MFWRLSRLIALVLALPAGAAAQPLAIAAASDLQPVLPGLVAQFESELRQPVRVTFGSSGNFFSQLRNGAPFDVLLSADIEYPTRLIADGKADGASLYTYAVGQLVIWSRSNAAVEVERGLAIVTDPAVTRVAIANPAHAPYGRAAMAAIAAAGLTAQVKPKLVLGENASQAAQFVQSGNAQIGLLPLSLALAPALAAAGRYWPVPAHLHPPIVQAAVILRASRHQAAAAQFLAFLRRDAVVRRLAESGFLTPGGTR